MIAGERGSAGEALEEDAAERIDIGTRIDRAAMCLLRGHVARCAE